MPCSDPIIALLEPFRPLFTAPTWKKMLVLRRRNPLGTRTSHRDRRPMANGP
jgi:hypothetical protein